jgi:hypothetical protein
LIRTLQILCIYSIKLSIGVNIKFFLIKIKDVLSLHHIHENKSESTTAVEVRGN